MWPVAGAVVPAVITGVCDWDTAEMSADTNDDDPGGVGDAVGVMLGVPELREVYVLLGCDLLLCSVTDKQRLASPLEGHVFPLWDVGQLDLDLRQGQDVSRGTHWGHELGHNCFGSIDTHHNSGSGHQVREGPSCLAAFLRGLLGIQHLNTPIVREVRDLDVCMSETCSKMA